MRNRNSEDRDQDRDQGYDNKGNGRDAGHLRLLSTLERLLAIEGTSVRSAMDRAADLIAQAIGAEKCDAFLYDTSIETLVAVGTSNTPMGIRQRQIGMDRLPIANDGREAEVLHSGNSYITGHAEQDPHMPVGLTKGLGVRSSIITPLVINGQRRGVMQACSTKPDAFSQDDLMFLEAVGHWVGAVAHRAELVEQITRDATLQARQLAADELVTMLAHDIGNYITPIKGRLDLMLRRARRQGDERGIQDAEASTLALNRLHSLITDLLDVSRLDQGIFALSRQPIDLASIAHETANAMQTSTQQIIVRAPDELRVDADPARIRQVVENLVANALKHSPKGVPVDVEVRSEERDDGGEVREWAVVIVRDEGPGIAPDVMPRLFTRFGAGPGSTGLGLGLYMARGIADAHGGTLTVESTQGQGTSFRFAVPCVPE